MVFDIRLKSMGLMLLLVLASQNAVALEQDKIKHLVVSAAISTILVHKTKFTRNAFYGCFSIGFVKELTDTHISGKDLIANAIGCWAGSRFRIAYHDKTLMFSKTWRF